MPVNYSTLQSDFGFKSDSFEVTPDGVLRVSIIDVQQIKLDGEPYVGTGAEPVTALSPLIVNSNLQTLGTLTSLTVAGNSSLTSGTVTITSSTTGNINNVNIGATTRATGSFTTLAANSTTTLTGAVNINGSNVNVTISPTGTGTIVLAPGTTGSINNVNIGATTAGTGRFTTLTLTQEATATDQVPTKGYVDRTATALSIALGS